MPIQPTTDTADTDTATPARMFERPPPHNSNSPLDSVPRRRSFGSKNDLSMLLGKKMSIAGLSSTPLAIPVPSHPHALAHVMHAKGDVLAMSTQSVFSSSPEVNDLKYGYPADFALDSVVGPDSQRERVPMPPRNAIQDLASKAASIVRNRTGSVLARFTIIKSDFFQQGININLDFHLQGAPNFRMTDLNICGTAQPTVSGIASILTLLKSHPQSLGTNKCVFISAREEPVIYINWRPFVLRENEHPFQNIKTFQGINGTRLEQMEARLKEDILKESARHGNMFLVHDEIEEGRIVPSWIGIDDLMTPKEVFQSLVDKRFRVVYQRIPISPEQSPDDRYMDEYVAAIKACGPEDHVVFNCGMGVGRTTFAMAVALVIRQSQKLLSSKKQQEAATTAALGGESGAFDMSPLGPRPSATSASQTWFGSNEAFLFDEMESQNRAMLRLVYILEKGLSNKVSPRSAIDWAMARGPLIEDLKSAVLGNYQYIVQLTSLLHRGSECKRILDLAIDKCDVMINLREVILLHRVQYSNTGDNSVLEKALGCLERYFFMLAFCSYVVESNDLGTGLTFSEWMQGREEIQRMLDSIRRRGLRLNVFKPVEDLAVFAEENRMHTGWVHQQKLIANELESFVMKWRHGSVLVQHMILKVDQWVAETRSQIPIDGILNIRKIPNWPVYGSAQPSIHGVVNLLKALTSPYSETLPNMGNMKHVCWINLREEPICYVNGQPYVLRDKSLTLRNTKAYAGITPARLEFIETQLKEDVVSELKNFDEKILVHIERNHAIHPVWEECSAEHVLTVREVVDLLKHEGYPLEYYRVPLTAERAPDPGDLDYMVKILSTIDLKNTAIVVNCQMGLGRSTVGTIVTSLILDWLKGFKLSCEDLSSPRLSPIQIPASNQKPLNYQVIHSLIRVIRNGASCRKWVDATIDACSTYSHIRDAIEVWRLTAESEMDEARRRRAVRKGLACLRRYFALLAFAAYLDSQPNNSAGHELTSFKSWMNQHKEFDTMLEEMEHCGFKSLVPVEHLSPGDGIALTNEVLSVVDARQGAVLAKHTILKVDVFPGAQKLSLIERVDGAPNYRRIPVLDVLQSISYAPSNHRIEDRAVYGIGMPTKDAIKNTLDRCSAGPGGSKKILWTSLREEPVIYVKGRPFVLRLFQDPLKNLETTGIVRERVEQMEQQMKADCIAELNQYGGRLLLHSEELTSTGFQILPVWESVSIDEIETPLEIYESIVEQKYQVDYKRVPITDEQAPIPDVFDQLVERLTVLEPDTEAVFNCQMGRGRTTTGTVIACLLEMIVGNKTLLKDPPMFEEVPASPTPFGPDGGIKEKESNEERYNNGEFKLILHVMGALEHGRIAKKMTDRAIDKCEQLQNLRIAVNDYKMRVEALENGSAKWTAMRSVALNYLMRYFYLIVFSEYLIEEMCEVSEWPAKPKQTFSNWLNDRREIQSIEKRFMHSLD
ncbi:inositol hexakisphosphate-domain-containing protein [Chytriomyces cf. hyalinus JEL632]|nr:inositol hexakisphosphate-domain-containing protein [Chytriomyces cf. hyalinus JEL632]